MNSSGHRANLLNDSYREIGVGLEVGQYRTYEGAFVTQNFARSGSNSFVTGVAIGDADGDKRYDIGEGLGGITVSAKNIASNAVTTTTTNGGRRASNCRSPAETTRSIFPAAELPPQPSRSVLAARI